MGAAEGALDPVRLLDAIVAALFAIRIVAEHGHDGVGFVEDDHAPVQVGYRDVVTLHGNRGRHAEASDDFVDVFALEAVVQQSAARLVIAVADQQAVRLVTRVERHAVRGVELPRPVAFGPEVLQVFTGFVEDKNNVAGVAVREKNITVRGYGDGGWVERLCSEPGIRREGEAQGDLSVGCIELDPFGVFVAGAVKVFGAVFIANLDVVQVGVRFAEKLARHLAVRRKSDHALVGAGVDRAVLADDHAAVRRADGGFALRGEPPAGHGVKRHQASAHADSGRRFRLGVVVMAVTVTLGVMMIVFGITVIVIGVMMIALAMIVTVIVRVLMVGLAAACQKQNSDKEGKKRLHSAGTLTTMEPLGKSF